MFNINKILIVFFTVINLMLTGAVAQQKSIQLRVVAEQANIRLKPDITSLIIYQAPKGTYLSMLEKEGDWYKITFVSDEGEEGSGYVHESLVMIIEPEIEEEKKPEKIKKPAEKVEEKIEEQTPPVKETQTAPTQKRTPFEPPSVLPPIQIALNGGGVFLGGGDLNRGSEGLAGFYKDSLGATSAGTVSPLHLSYNLGVELNINLSPQLRLGIGLDYFKGDKESKIEIIKGTRKDLYITRPEIQAVPLRVSLIYFPANFFYLTAGIDYYFAKVNYDYRIQTGEDWIRWRGEATSRSTGLRGGAGVVAWLSSYFGLFIETTGQYAEIGDFKGTNIYLESGGESSEEEGSLYIYQARVSAQKSHPLLFISSQKPGEAGVSDVKEAVVSFSGLTVKAGLRFRF